LKALETNVREDAHQQAMDNDVLMGEIRTLKQMVFKGEERIAHLEKENKAMAMVMKKVLEKVANPNRDVIQVGNRIRIVLYPFADSFFLGSLHPVSDWRWFCGEPI
jgi:hypothetical protein